MLIWSDRARRGVLAVFAVLVLGLLVAPTAVVVVAAVARTWNSVLPGSWTGKHLADALSDDNFTDLVVSIKTALAAGAAAVVVGTTAAVSAARLPRRLRRVMDAVFHLPVAVPSVVIGLGLLVAFSQRPILLNGTTWIVVLAQSLLVLAFAYSTVAAGMERLDRALLRAAASLGAPPWMVLLRVQLPLLLPAISAAGSLSVALCMGELGATIMVYPAQWRPLPVSIFALSDRGQVFLASADTLVLLVTTFLLLSGISAIGGARRWWAAGRRLATRRRRRTAALPAV